MVDADGGSGVFIGAWRLPEDLVQAIGDGRWVAPTDPAIYPTVFGDDEASPAFFDLAAMVVENEVWQHTSADSIFGTPMSSTGIGIDTAQSILIATIGPDMPVVLDYRESVTRPRVIYFRDQGWFEVTGSIADLLTALHLI